eukprot:scaffold322217_cov17-Tisochrysis_lutea.AAC.1
MQSGALRLRHQQLPLTRPTHQTLCCNFSASKLKRKHTGAALLSSLFCHHSSCQQEHAACLRSQHAGDVWSPCTPAASTAACLLQHPSAFLHACAVCLCTSSCPISTALKHCNT